MAADAKTGEKQDLVEIYDDGQSWPNNTLEQERAYREGFVEESRRIVRDGVSRDDAIRLKAAQRHREMYRDHSAVYRIDSAGRMTHHFGYRSGHEVYAARLRGHFHALEFVMKASLQAKDFYVFDRLIIPVWLGEVERWAKKRISQDDVAPPPFPHASELKEKYGVDCV